jgi:hypothetical protein
VAWGGEEAINSTISAAEGIPNGTTVAKVLSAEEIELSEEVTGLTTSPAENASLTLTPQAVPASCETDHAGAASAENPEADPGVLCVFVANEQATGGGAFFMKKPTFQGATFGASRAGGFLLVGSPAGLGKDFWGTYAVTGAP